MERTDRITQMTFRAMTVIVFGLSFFVLLIALFAGFSEQAWLDEVPLACLEESFEACGTDNGIEGEGTDTRTRTQVRE